MKAKSNAELMKWMRQGISSIGDQEQGSESQHHWFKVKMKDLKKLWKEKKISWLQLSRLYQQAQDEMNYKWEDRAIEDILT